MAGTESEHLEIKVAAPVGFTRVYTGARGETHFSDETLSFELVDYAPPAAPISLSAIFTAQNICFISSPAGWHGDWHRAPHRQFVLGLVGELEVEVSDGEVRRFGPGSVILVEDTSGKGHLSRVVGTERMMAAAVPLADR